MAGTTCKVETMVSRLTLEAHTVCNTLARIIEFNSRSNCSSLTEIAGRELHARQ
jgi:hypothetical protein